MVLAKLRGLFVHSRPNVYLKFARWAYYNLDNVKNFLTKFSNLHKRFSNIEQSF